MFFGDVCVYDFCCPLMTFFVDAWCKSVGKNENTKY